jgi:aminoglycoside phosphotransferase (APT) family kinase protein
MGLNGSGAQLIKYTVNAVYQLTEPVIVRVGSGDVGHFRGQRLVEVARWLTDQDAPTIRLIDGNQPVSVDGYTITFWHKVGAREDWTADDLAAPLRSLHRLTPPGASVLPAWDPFETARRRLASADARISADDLQWLHDQWQAVEHDYLEIRSTMPMGIVHGDPHTGNLLVDERGRIVLCDLDETGIGPLAWDLVPQAVGAVRFDRTAFYEQFASAYGSDVRELPEWQVLARIRELIMVTSVLPDLAHRPEIAEQQAHRLASLRAGDTSAIWRPYR